MSKNITIQEGGIGKQLTVDKLKTNLVGGGTCLWVPEDGIRLIKKYVSENGTYKASSDGYYGYSELIVNVPGGAGGSPGGPGSRVEGTDGDGDDAITEVGPGGDLQTKKVPSAIEITTPPTLTTYRTGQSIDYSGMVVKMKLKTGGVFTDNAHSDGVLKKSELTLPITTATMDGSDYYDVVPLIDIGDVNLRVGSTVTLNSTMGWTHTWSAPYATAFISGNQITKIGASSNANDQMHFSPGSDPDDTAQSYALSSSYTEAGYTVYYYANTASWSSFAGGSPISDGSITNIAKIAWNMVYGSKIAGIKNVPVQWVSSYDGRQFEDTFQITVV